MMTVPEAYDAGIVHQALPGAGVSDVMTLGKIVPALYEARV